MDTDNLKLYSEDGPNDADKKLIDKSFRINKLL